MTAARAYYCPMHRDAHGVDGGRCPHCHMDLLPEGSRFGLVRHLLGNPLHLGVMIAIMLGLMAALMLIPR